jgi:alpha-beta hydrolase superfamily lysophospholipase
MLQGTAAADSAEGAGRNAAVRRRLQDFSKLSPGPGLVSFGDPERYEVSGSRVIHKDGFPVNMYNSRASRRKAFHRSGKKIITYHGYFQYNIIVRIISAWYNGFMAGSTPVKEEWFKTGGARLFLRRWLSAEKPLGILHIVHGMAEHGLRYDRFARRLAGEGFEVWAADQRGHGKTADPAVNDPGGGGLMGHCGDREAYKRAAEDIEEINLRIRENFPERPLFLMGHSWGSFLVQYNIEECEKHISGCILSGTRGPDGLKIKTAPAVLTLLAFIKGCRKKSDLAFALADKPYNRPFRPNRTAFDWLSRDEKEVDKYIADPLCGMRCSSGFYRDMAFLLNRIHRNGQMRRIRRDLPVYIFSGGADPVGEMGVSPSALAAAYRSIGIQDIEFVLYPDARHEILNETNRNEVTENLIAWLKKHSAK